MARTGPLYTVLVLAGAAALAVPAAGQRDQQTSGDVVEPTCTPLFGPPTPSCLCSRSGNGDWAITCGCPAETFPPDKEVSLTPLLLPPGDDAADGLVITLISCRRTVHLSTALLTAADRQFSTITLEATDTTELRLPESAAATGQVRFNSVTARLERVTLPRLTGALFAQRLAVRAEFVNVRIGEIAAGAFRQSLVAPEVAIERSRVGRIAAGAFALPVGVESSATRLTGLRIARSRIDEWQSDAHVGGVALSVVDSTVGRLCARAVSTAGVVELHWNQTTVGEVEPRAVYEHVTPPPDTLPANILGFYGNTFEAVAAAGDDISVGLLHFQRGVPSALEFLDNDVSGSRVPPVTPDPWPEQVAGTRLQCTCDLLQPWLPASEAFRVGAQCRPSSPGDIRLRNAADFFREECEGDDDDDEDGRGDNTRMAPPNSSGARLAAAIAQLAAGLYSTYGTMTLTGHGGA